MQNDIFVRKTSLSNKIMSASKPADRMLSNWADIGLMPSIEKIREDLHLARISIIR